MSSGPQTDETSAIRTWAGKRRAAGIMAVVAIGFFGVIMSELDKPIFITDDAVATVLGAATLMLYLLWRKKTSLSDLKKHANVFTGLLVVAFLVKTIWIFVEMGDPDAFGDDIPALFFLIAVLVNRFG